MGNKSHLFKGQFMNIKGMPASKHPRRAQIYTELLLRGGGGEEDRTVCSCEGYLMILSGLCSSRAHVSFSSSPAGASMVLGLLRLLSVAH